MATPRSILASIRFGGGYADRREKVARNIERWMRKTDKERKYREENGDVA